MSNLHSDDSVGMTLILIGAAMFSGTLSYNYKANN